MASISENDRLKIGRLNALRVFKLQDNVTFSEMKRASAARITYDFTEDTRE